MTDRHTHISDQNNHSEDPRHARRVRIVQRLFADTFVSDSGTIIAPFSDDASIQSTIAEIHSHKTEIDAQIQRFAPRYTLDKISKIDVSILRLAFFELMFVAQEPAKVIINEAVELGREMGNDRSYAFINAVLGAYQSSIQIQS